MPADPAIVEASAAEQRLMLRRLAEIGMALAEVLPEQAKAENADSHGIALSYSRISRAVRLSLALEMRTFEPPAPEPYVPPWDRDDDEHGDLQLDFAKIHADVRREETYELIEKAIDREYDPDEKERLTLGLYERMEDERDEEAFAADAPVAQVIMGICRDLGLDPDWSALRDEDWDVAGELTKLQLRIGKFDQPDPEEESAIPRTWTAADPARGPPAPGPSG